MIKRSALAAVLMLGAVVAVPRADEIYMRRGTNGTPILTNVPRAGREWRRVADPGRQPAVQREARDTPALRPRPYDGAVRRVAAHFGVDPRLVHAIIEVESGYDARAVSPRGAIGLMQVMPATAAELGLRNLAAPEVNIVAGVRHLRRLLDRYRGNVDLALAAYNAGSGAVARYGGVPPYNETRRYIQRVRLHYGGGGLAPAADPNRLTRYVNRRGILVITQFPDSADRSPRLSYRTR